MYNLASVSLGLIGWAVPAIARVRGWNLLGAFTLSEGFCIFALYLQFYEYERLVGIHDFAAIADIVHGEVIAATVLIGVTLAANLLNIALPKNGRIVQ